MVPTPSPQPLPREGGGAKASQVLAVARFSSLPPRGGGTEGEGEGAKVYKLFFSCFTAEESKHD